MEIVTSRKIVEKDIALERYINDLSPIGSEPPIYEIEKKGKCRKTDYVWLTVNPKPEVELSELKECTERLVALKPVFASLYVYEQRGSCKEEMGKGQHIHLLIKRHGKPFLLTNAIHRIYDNLVGLPDKHINIMWIRSDQCQEKWEYLQGNKSGKEKQAKVIMDKEWRKLKGLKDIYGSDNSSVLKTC